MGPRAADGPLGYNTFPVVMTIAGDNGTERVITPRGIFPHMTGDDERLLAKARRLAGLIECADCGGLTLSQTGRCRACREEHVRTIV